MNKNEELLPYYEKAKELLNYDSATGKFTRFVRYKNSYKELSERHTKGYMSTRITINKTRKVIKLHRLAWYIKHGELPNIIDHIDRDKSNNKISNLRSCTQQENAFNRGVNKNSTSGYKGVTYAIEKKKYRAYITFNYKRLHLGYFDCPNEASKVYEAKAKELFGEYYMDNKR